MCGIAGIIGPGAEAEERLVREMTGLLAHRGPDDSGIQLSPGVALGHRRLSILDRTPAGRQPMSTVDGRYQIVYNGEIYNYLELRQELASKGYVFLTGTDTEVLLAAYAEWKESCLKKLNGMWAFAVWDSKERRLFASRDRFGKKPFYYVRIKDRLYFASEMKALLLIPGLTRTLNPEAVADFCTQRVVSHLQTTFIREIQQLPAAHWMKWEEGRVEENRYWELPPAGRPGDKTVSREEVEALLSDAVKIRLRADTPVGCLVSGGLDSSVIACLVRRHQPAGKPVHLFTTLTEPPTEEAEGVAHLLKMEGFQPHFHTPTAKGFWEDLPRLLWHQEQPFADGSMAAHYALMREASEAGIPVLLTGQGADEIFAGYPTYLWVYLGDQLRHGRWGSALQWMRKAARAQPLSASRILFYTLPRGLRGRVRRARSASRDHWINKDFLSGMKSREIWLDAGGSGELDQYLRNSITQWTLPGFLHYEDRNSMAFGVETRLPFLDYRLAEAAFRIPPGEHLRDGKTKALLRDAVAGWVPAPIVQRTAKQGYPAPLSCWMRALEKEIREIAASSVVGDCPILNAPAWRRSLEGFLEGREDLLDPAWRGLVCAMWHDRFFKS